MTVLIDLLSGAIGAIIIIVVSLGLPFVRKIIFKLFETKVDERANKAISDHNAKNDTKIHISKTLFDLEQKAISIGLEYMGEISKIIIDTGCSFNAITGAKSEYYNKFEYLDKIDKLPKIILEYSNKFNVIYTVYLPDNLATLFRIGIQLYKDVPSIFFKLIKENNTTEFQKYFTNISQDIQTYNRELNRAIREYYNSVKIV